MGATEDEKVIAWARELFQSTAPYATGGLYVNFMTEEDQEKVTSAYGHNYERLAQLKKQYDPTNLFRTNQNVAPVGR